MLFEVGEQGTGTYMALLCEVISKYNVYLFNNKNYEWSFQRVTPYQNGH